MHLFLSFSFTFIPYNKSPIQSYTGVTTYFIQFRAEYTVVLIVVFTRSVQSKKSFRFLYDMCHVLYHWATTLRAQ